MRNRRVGFTLVELLVVIAIIGILAALIVPAVQSAIGTANDNTCRNNISQQAKAMINYATNKGFFPGYRNAPVSTASGALPVSWQTVLLPELEEKSLYDQWVAGAAASSRYKQMSVYMCPGDSTASGTTAEVTSYAVNAGRPFVDVATDSAYARYAGVCNDLSGLPAPAAAPKNALKLGLTDFRDGATNTVLLTENQDANLWHIDGYTTTQNPEDVQAVVFWVLGGAQYRINDGRGRRTFSSTPVLDYKFARPSSGHATTFNVAFADGHVKAINFAVTQQPAPSDGTPPAQALVWDMLQTPWGAKSGPNGGQTGTLSDAEF